MFAAGVARPVRVTGSQKSRCTFCPTSMCPAMCKGKRYNWETLEIKFKDLNISEVLNLTVEDALSFFDAVRHS